MSREAMIVLDCRRYSQNIADIIEIFRKTGWRVRNKNNLTEFLPLGDNDQYNWQTSILSDSDLTELILQKQNNSEKVGINLFYEHSNIGISLLAETTSEIILSLDINRQTVSDSNNITDIGWYFNNIILKLHNAGCYIDYFQFSDYTD